MSKDIFYMTKALLKRDDIDAQLMTIPDKILDLRTGVGVPVANLRVFPERVGAFPFPHQRVNAFLVQVPGQGLEGRHPHHLDAKVQMETLDEARTGALPTGRAGYHYQKDDEAASSILFHI